MKIFGIDFDKEKLESYAQSVSNEHEYDVFVKCKKCGTEEWISERFYNGNGLCRKHNEEKHEEECKIEREKRELTYCKDREHNYIAIPGSGIENYDSHIICSKCGKYLK